MSQGQPTSRRPARQDQGPPGPGHRQKRHGARLLEWSGVRGAQPLPRSPPRLTPSPPGPPTAQGSFLPHQRQRFDSLAPARYRPGMPRNGSITVGDLVGKLEFLTLECNKCGRRGRYRVSKLLAELGPDGMLTYWSERI